MSRRYHLLFGESKERKPHFYGGQQISHHKPNGFPRQATQTSLSKPSMRLLYNSHRPQARVTVATHKSTRASTDTPPWELQHATQSTLDVRRTQTSCPPRGPHLNVIFVAWSAALIAGRRLSGGLKIIVLHIYIDLRSKTPVFSNLQAW